MMPSFRIQALWLVLPLMLAGAAPAMAADTAPVVTRPIGAVPVPAPAAEPSPLLEDFGPQWVEAAPPNDGKIHGMVSGSVGTSGYREGAVALEGPLPNGGTVAIAVDASQIDYSRGRRDRASAQPSAN